MCFGSHEFVARGRRPAGAPKVSAQREGNEA